MQQIEITLDGESLVTPETIATAVFSSKINDGRNSDLKTAEAELAIF